MSGTKLKPVYLLGPQNVVLVLLVLAIAAYAQQVSEKSLVSISTVSKLDLPFPGLGHIRKDGNTYTWVPVDYVNDAITK